jgi:hypothetical protein
LPPGIRITTNWAEFESHEAFWYSYDGRLSQDLWPAAISRVFNRSFDLVVREYSIVRTSLVRPSEAISTALSRQLPGHFTAVHLRRGDKVREGQVGAEANVRARTSNAAPPPSLPPLRASPH